jgi:type I restriction enzyme S subunit
MIGTVGNSYLEKSNNIDYAVKNVGIFKNKNSLDGYWLFYYLKSPFAREYLHSRLSGSTQQYITLNSLREYPILNPSRTTKEAIVTILSSLDDKIELNNKINKTLEELAQTLYKHWFVDFEFPNEEGKPYKSSGGEMIESELGNIPKGWNVNNLSEVLENVRTKSGERTLPVFSALKEGVLVLSSDFFNKNVPSKSLSKYLVVERGSFAYNPSRINIGSIGLNDFDFTGCVSPVYVVMKTESHYLYFFNEFFRTERFVQEVNLRASGSVRQSLSYSDLGMIKITYPPTELVIRFNDFYINFKDTIKNNLEQNIRMEQIRDLLLPKLMSGEIEV